ncbi:MAG: hypothetical protein WEF50_16080 [Myxococcota bacterium]
MVSQRTNVSIAPRAFAWLFALAIAVGTPQASVLCESNDGHVAVERAHVSGVCFAEAVRHASQPGVVGGSEAPDCADTLLDRSLVREEDSPNGARTPSLPCVGCGEAPAEPEASRVGFDAELGDRLTRLRHTRHRRTVQLQL